LLFLSAANDSSSAEKLGHLNGELAGTGISRKEAALRPLEKLPSIRTHRSP
jgi:hypothetical protein